MTRRHSGDVNDLADAAAATSRLEMVHMMIRQLLPEQHQVVLIMRTGLDGTVRSREEVGQHLGLSPNEVEWVEWAALRKLRNYHGIETVRPYLEFRSWPIPQRRREELFPPESSHQELLECARHGWIAYVNESDRCPMCPCAINGETTALGTTTRRGRPRKFCSAACKQAAHRQRQAVR
jgi:hypothetical protein